MVNSKSNKTSHIIFKHIRDEMITPNSVNANKLGLPSLLIPPHSLPYTKTTAFFLVFSALSTTTKGII